MKVKWKRDIRTCWLWCPNCHRDLNGDAKSFVRDTGDTWEYHCFDCGEDSVFSLAYPIPVLLTGDYPPTTEGESS